MNKGCFLFSWAAYLSFCFPDFVGVFWGWLGGCVHHAVGVGNLPFMSCVLFLLFLLWLSCFFDLFLPGVLRCLFNHVGRRTREDMYVSSEEKKKGLLGIESRKGSMNELNACVLFLTWVWVVLSWCGSVYVWWVVVGGAVWCTKLNYRLKVIARLDCWRWCWWWWGSGELEV